MRSTKIIKNCGGGGVIRIKMRKMGYILEARGRFWDPKTPHIITKKGSRSLEGRVYFGSRQDPPRGII